MTYLGLSISATWLLALAMPAAVLDGSAQHANALARPDHAAINEGIRFSCRPHQLEGIEAGMDAYLAWLGIGADLLVKKIDSAKGFAVYTLNTPGKDGNTLDLKTRPGLQIQDEIVSLPMPHGKNKNIQTVSKKEIVLALLQHGRLTEFKGDACDIEALKDHVGIRQNTVAWSENLQWTWPNGGAAQWNKKYWKDGTPKPGFPLHEAINDIFMHQNRYSIGCYTATKLVVVQGVLDYYHRLKPDPVRQSQLEQRLSLNKEPLVGIEPGRMWHFEQDFDPQELRRPGKLLKIGYGAAPRNFVPGDWVYFLNTDPVSYQKTGYEGSNAIYLGRNKFDDYYNDNHHSYTYEEKLDEVFQWRNSVFSRSRDFAKIQALTAEQMALLGKTPAEGGLLTDMRVTPYFFGHEELPLLAAP